MKIASILALIFLWIPTFISCAINLNNSFVDLILLNEGKSTQTNEPINFNFVKIGDTRLKTFYIENTGTNSYSIQKIQFLKNGLGVFSFTANPNPPTTISPNKLINITLTFSPNKVGDFFDTLLIFFNEPFYFVYSLPVEGHSLCTNLILVLDTSNFVGTSNFKVPIIIKGDPNLVEAIPINLTLLITTNAKIFYVDSIYNGNIADKTINQTYISYKVNFNNFLLDSSEQTLCSLIGRLFLSNQDTTIITLSQAACDVIGVNFETQNGSITTYGICVSTMSLINFDYDYIEIKLFNEIATDELKIAFSNYGKKEKFVTIALYNLQGNKIYQTTVNASVEAIIPLNNFPSGVYQVEISTDTQKYSKLISVIK